MSKPAGGYRRWLAVGCSHGNLADPAAIKAVLKFKSAWKPHRTIHLGDFVDTAAFRTGARGTSDQAMSLKADIGQGLNFLRALEPTDVLLGNHEDRLWTAAVHYDAIRRELAERIVNDIRGTITKLKAQFIDHYDINRSWMELGDTKFIHGFPYSQNALREHAEHFGKCVIAHLHIAGIEPGKRSDHPVAYCVGTLANIPEMGYAKVRRATARWSHAFAYGEFREGECHVNLSHCEPGNALNWRLPL